MELQLQDGENIIKRGKANLVTFWGSKGGELVLTNIRLIFSAHAFNFGSSSGISIKRSDILGFSKDFVWPKVLFIPIPIPIPSAIKVATNSGKTHKFVVSGRKDWITTLKNS